MMYDSWDMELNRQNFLSFWIIFCLFTPLTTQKIKILKKKKSMELSSFHTFVPKIVIRWCMVLEIWCMTDGRTDKQMDRWRADRRKKWHKEAPPIRKVTLSYFFAQSTSSFIIHQKVTNWYETEKNCFLHQGSTTVFPQKCWFCNCHAVFGHFIQIAAPPCPTNWPHLVNLVYGYIYISISHYIIESRKG